MAICTWCNQEMKSGVGCSLKEYDDLGPLPLKRIPYGGITPCRDCKCSLGTLHHPGCDMERCPKCGGQALSCGCADKPESR